ncbi:MAG: hypothetical protein ACE15C_06515 [Phycisphaerae bacterium]
MGLIDSLINFGGKLGVLRLVSTTAPAAAGKIPTRRVTLKDLATEVRAEEVRLLADLPAELSVEFAKVFEAAGIKTPHHGWTVERLARALDAPPYKGMAREAAQKALLEMLAADGAHVHEVVQDAVARDKALDAFEEFAHKKWEGRTTSRQLKIADIETQIQALQEQCAHLRSEDQADKAQWDEWRGRKVQCEKDMARAVGYLVHDPVVTTDEQAAKLAGH